MRSKFKWIYALVIALTMQFSFAQQKTVTGTVKDSNGMVLSGANVKNGSEGVATNADGKFAIKAKQGDELKISYAGMDTYVLTIGPSDNYNVKMSSKAIIGEEVVIVGINQAKRKGAITSTSQQIKADELNKASAPNAVQAMVGKVSGLQINTTNSGVSAENRVVLRGNRSISGNNQALVVIDGAVSSLSVLQQIAPESIANINVMKGAQGAAIYGSDGVNGVIIVTTVKGSGDRFKVNFKSSLDISTIAYLPTRQLRYGQGWDGLHASQENGSWGPEFDGTMQPVGLAQADGTFITAPYSPIKNGYKKFFQNGMLSQNSLSINGGNMKDGYFSLTLNNFNNQFIVKGDQLKRNSFLFKAGKKIGKFSLEGNVNYINEAVNQSNSDLYSNLLQSASNIPIQLFENSGNDHAWTTYYNNPYWLRDNQRRNNFNNYFAGIVSLGYEINKNINVTYLANLRLNTSDYNSYNNPYVDNVHSIYGGNSRSITGEFLSGTSLSRNFYGDLVVNFNYDLSKDFTLKALVGNNLQDVYAKVNEVGGTNFAVPGVYSFGNMQNQYLPGVSTLNGVLSNGWSRRRKASVFAEATLGYKDYLFLNATARNDWSSVFIKENRSFFYPSVGVSYLPLKSFDIDSNTFNFLKVYANWTRVGNESLITAYSINQLGVLAIGYPFSGSNSYVQQLGQVNQNINPEFMTTTEIGMSSAFFKDRITLDASYYVTDTKGLITNSSAAAPSGLNTLTGNLGLMQTKGFEIDLGFTPIKSKKADGFRWENKLGISHYRSIVKKVTDEANQVALRAPYSFVGIYAQEGEAFPTIKGTQYLRDDYGRVIVDGSGNPTLDPTLKVLGTAAPDYIINFSPSVSYKGVKLSATMDYRGGKNYKFYSDVKRTMSWTGQLVESAENRSGFILNNSSYDYNGNGIIEANEGNTNVVTGGGSTASFINYYNSYYSVTGENLVINASAFKLREVSLSYTFSKKMLDKTFFNSIVVSFNTRNPISVFAKQNRYYNDPETSETTGNAAGLAFLDRYPPQSTYGFSINVGF